VVELLKARLSDDLALLELARDAASHTNFKIASVKHPDDAPQANRANTLKIGAFAVSNNLSHT
jgi:hypothetical protein